MLAAVAETLVWWALAVGIWLLSLSSYDGQDMVVALACGLPCALAAVAGRRAVRGSWRPPGGLAGAALTVPVAVVSDAAQVLVAGLRPGRALRGSLRTVQLGGAGDDPRAAGRRALAAILVSTPPGSYVVDVDPDAGTALVHSLPTRGPRVEGRLAP